MDTALLIIDVQQALSCGDDEVFDSRGVIDRINRVSRLAACDFGALRMQPSPRVLHASGR